MTRTPIPDLIDNIVTAHQALIAAQGQVQQAQADARAAQGRYTAAVDQLISRTAQTTPRA